MLKRYAKLYPISPRRPSTMRLRNFILTLAICLFGCYLPAFSQSTFGSIVGTVLDASGAVIPGARIRLTNVEQNTSRTVESEASGLFEFLNLLPGRYTILAPKPGFASVN